MATLVVERAGKTEAFALKEGQNQVGRRPDGAVRTNHPATSGRHAVFDVQGDQCFVEDCGSRNGTFVNGQRIAGPAIGMIDGYPFQAETRKLDLGGMIVITTDGVEKAMNPEGELYGTERVMELVRRGPPEAEKLGKQLLADVRRRAPGASTERRHHDHDLRPQSARHAGDIDNVAPVGTGAIRRRRPPRYHGVSENPCRGPS